MDRKDLTLKLSNLFVDWNVPLIIRKKVINGVIIIVEQSKSDHTNHLENEIDKLAKFIMFNIPGEPSQSEGACDTAIRLLKNKRAE